MFDLKDITQRQVGLINNKVYSMPVLILMPHSRCNCRCVMCDIWKANKNKKEITKADLEPHLESFKSLNVKWVSLSGGEALMHSNLWVLCEALKAIGVKISLLSTGLLLPKHRNEIIQYCDEVIVSLDGSEEIHDYIRNIPNAYKKLEAGINSLRELDSSFHITGRCVLQKLNYFDFHNIIESAKSLELNSISFLAADVSSSAFNREIQWHEEKVSEVALTKAEIKLFEEVMENAFITFKKDFDSKFIVEDENRMRKIIQHYKSFHGLTPAPSKKCNAPWVSSVIESNGDVMPCFFHKPIGNIHEQPFGQILNSPRAIQFRKELNIDTDPICENCVCYLNLKPHKTV